MALRIPRIVLGFGSAVVGVVLPFVGVAPAGAASTTATAPAVSAIRPSSHAARLTPLLQLPSFKVSSKIVAEGVDKKTGKFLVPSDPRIVGWNSYGPQPGEPGTALFFGHRSSQGALWHVPDMKAGTALRIVGLNGVVTSWKIMSLQEVRKDSLPASLFDNTGPSRVALVTCGGIFDYRIGHFKDNVIAWAVPAK